MSEKSRNFHRKSRHGCSQCKKRRVRCNLEHPVCGHCWRRNEPCSYITDGFSPRYHNNTRATTMGVHEAVPDVLKFQAMDPPSITPSGTDSPKGTTESHGDHANISLNPETLRWVLDSLSLQQTNSITELDTWCNTLAHQARSNDYVHSSLLALIALHHWRHGSPNPDAHAVASKQYIAASNAFRSRAPHVTQDNWLSVLIFGITVLIYNIVVSTSPPAVPTITTNMIMTEGEGDIYEKFYDVFCLFRTSGGLGHELGHFLKKSPLMNYIDQHESLGPGCCGLSAEDCQALDRLASGEHMHGLPEDIKIQCNDASQTLTIWASSVDGKPSRWMHFLWWPNAISSNFVKLVHQKSPPALLIFIYWCAIMHRGPQRWFLNGWAREAAYSATLHLDGCYEALLRWPMSGLEKVSPVLAVEMETQRERIAILENV